MIFVINPLFTTLIAFLTQAALIMGYLWFDKLKEPTAKYDCPLIHGGRALAFCFFVGFGLVSLDSTVKVLILGVYGRTAILQHVAGCILSSVVAVIYIIGAVFTAPSRKGIATFFVMVGTFLFMYEYYIPNHGDTDIPYYFLHIFVGFGFLLISWIGEQIVRKFISGESFPEGVLWDKSEKFKRIFSWKVHLVLLALLATEVLLNQSGYSFFVWQ